MKSLIAAGFLAALYVAPCCAAEDVPPPGFDPQKYMRVGEVKAGMKGYGLSVFRGTKIERFDVEVVSVLHNFNPQRDVVLIRCKGANLEHTGAVAGMSGSPVYLYDGENHARLIGAFAYGWTLMKDPVAGVQPIEYMLGIPRECKPKSTTQPADTTAAQAIGPATWSIGRFLSTQSKAEPKQNAEPAGPAGMLGDVGGEMRLRPLATPLMLSGISSKAFKPFEAAFAAQGMIACQVGSAGADPAAAAAEAAPLEPGAAMAIPLVSGDADMTAIGTVTAVIGDRVFAFGHSLNNEGDIALPMSSGFVHTVLASLNNSLKLGAATQLRGTLDCDEISGVSGRMGPAPVTIPVELRCVYGDGSFDRTFHFNVAQHAKMTPLLIASVSAVAMSSARELPQYHTLDYDVTLEFSNKQTLRIQNRAANTSAQEMFLALGQPIMAAADNPFERVALTKVSGTMRILPGAKQAEVLSVSVPRSKLRPGETLKAFVTYRPFRGMESMLPVEFELPRDLPDGAYDFAVMDWQAELNDEQAARPFRFTAQSAAEVFAVLRDYTAVRRDALYLRLLRQPDGVAIGRTAMARLPSSQRRVLLSAGLSNMTAFVSSTVKRVPTDYVMSGQAHLNITIDREGKVDAARKVAKPEMPAPPPPKKAADAKAKAAAVAEE